jgi:hypothetical protein
LPISEQCCSIMDMNQSPHRRSWWLVLALLVLAPICAEYLSAYDDSTGHPATLLGNLVIFIPLYGCSALLIREVARRPGSAGSGSCCWRPPSASSRPG